MAEAALLLYEPSAPCWDEETFVLAGEAPGTADRLTSLGLLEKTAGGCILTAKGLAEREAAGRELVFLSSEPWPESWRPAGVREAAVFDAPYAADSVWIYRWPTDAGPTPP